MYDVLPNTVSKTDVGSLPKLCVTLINSLPEMVERLLSNPLVINPVCATVVTVPTTSPVLFPSKVEGVAVLVVDKVTAPVTAKVEPRVVAPVALSVPVNDNDLSVPIVAANDSNEPFET